MNIEDNKDGNNEDNDENQNKESSRRENNEQTKNGIEIYQQDIDIEKAFEKHDRITRTPPEKI